MIVTTTANKPFVPVNITLETKAEVALFAALISKLS